MENGLQDFKALADAPTGRPHSTLKTFKSPKQGPFQAKTLIEPVDKVMGGGKMTIRIEFYSFITL
jgi:hypothetical protein